MVMFEELQVMTAYPYSNNIFKLLEEKSISLARRALSKRFLYQINIDLILGKCKWKAF